MKKYQARVKLNAEETWVGTLMHESPQIAGVSLSFRTVVEARQWLRQRRSGIRVHHTYEEEVRRGRWMC